ncbi:UNVERIFIED_CONTAM: hypothetical protein Sindi_0898900 [Sesamum indicum]
MNICKFANSTKIKCWVPDNKISTVSSSGMSPTTTPPTLKLGLSWILLNGPRGLIQLAYIHDRTAGLSQACSDLSGRRDADPRAKRSEYPSLRIAATNLEGVCWRFFSMMWKNICDMESLMFAVVDNMEGGESLLDTLFDEEIVDDGQDVEMLDIEEGELTEQISNTEVGESCDVGNDQENQESNRRISRQKKRKKKNKRKRGSSAGPNITNINRFVLDACKRLREKKSYLMWTAVGCLGVSALSDLVKECPDDGHKSLLQISSPFGWTLVRLWSTALPYMLEDLLPPLLRCLIFVSHQPLILQAEEACGGQKTADGSRFRSGGGILWNIIKVRDPNAYKEIMRKGKEFEKQFKQQLHGKQEPKQQAEASSPSITLDANQAKSNISDCLELTCHDRSQHELMAAPQKRASVHERIRMPVTYDDLPGGEDPKDELGSLK